MDFLKNHRYTIVWTISAVVYAAITATSAATAAISIVAAIALTLYMTQLVLPARGKPALWTLVPVLALFGAVILMSIKHIAPADAIINGFMGYAIGMFVTATFVRLTDKSPSRTQEPESKDKAVTPPSEDTNPKQ